jgi:hypothetical protein
VFDAKGDSVLTNDPLAAGVGAVRAFGTAPAGDQTLRRPRSLSAQPFTICTNLADQRRDRDHRASTVSVQQAPRITSARPAPRRRAPNSRNPRSM